MGVQTKKLQFFILFKIIFLKIRKIIVLQKNNIIWVRYFGHYRFMLLKNRRLFLIYFAILKVDCSCREHIKKNCVVEKL